MDHYATQTGQSSIPGQSHDEPQPQPQRAEPVPFDMYAHPSQYAPPGPAPTAYGIENPVFNAGMAQYGQLPLMPDMMGPTAVPPPFAPYFPQSQMDPGPSYDPSIPPPFEPYFSQSQMGLEPSYDPSTPPSFENYLPQLQMIPGPSHRPSSPLPFGVYLPQPQTAAGTSYGHPIPAPQYYDEDAPGPLAMGVAPSDYPSVPSTVPSLDGQHLEHGPLQEARVGKRKAVDNDDAGRKTRTKRLRTFHDIPPDFTRVVKRGKVLYKCTLPQCEQTEPMKKTSIPKHIRSNTHNERAGLYICTYCGKDFSRSDSLSRHLKSCSKKVASVPQGPDDIAPASSVPQPPMPQAPFTFQTVWDPRSELTSATSASSKSED